MATFSVTNTNDIGVGSLRQAIREANALAGRDTINFDGVFADKIADTIILGGSSLNITDDLSINGPGAEKLTVSGNNTSRVFDITYGITVEVDGLTVANGYLPDAIDYDSNSEQEYSGAGIRNSGRLTVNNSTISGNKAGLKGGGIYNYSYGSTLTVNNSTISGNSAQSGSGIANSFSGSLTVTHSTIENNAAKYGGGIQNYATATVSNSTINDNTAEYGGGIANQNGTLKVINTTISHNTAEFQGGGIFNKGDYLIYSGYLYATLTVSNSTITLNISESKNQTPTGGGIYNENATSVNNSIIAGNFDVPSNDLTNSLNPDVFGNFTSNGFNLIGSLSGSRGFNNNEQLNVGITEIIDTNLLLNGGSVKTHALVTGSRAINGGNNLGVPADLADIDHDGSKTERIPFDQRGSGFARISGGRVDIGAFEAAVNLIKGTANSDIIKGTAENDLIISLQKADILTGDTGADSFVYRTIRDLGDTITDFEIGIDNIDLTQVFKSLGLDNLTYASAISGGYLGFENQASNTIILIDPDGSSGIGRAVEFITLNNIATKQVNNAINFAFLGAPSSTFSVTNTNDSGAGSLRQAILDANALTGKDTITFDGVFADNIADTITLSGTSLVITDDLLIDSTGADLLTVSGDNASSVFEIGSDATVEITGLTIADGNSFDPGGGIYNSGNLTVYNSTFTGNLSYQNGGGIYNSGNLTVYNSTFTGNESYNGGGAIFGGMIIDSTIIGNKASYGGGIANATSVINSIIGNNSVGSTGGGISNTKLILNSTISGNSANADGGGIDGADFVINSTISSNSAGYGGGGIFNSNQRHSTISNSTISGNLADFGGGIYNSTDFDNNSTQIEVSNSTIIGNSGGIANNGIAIVKNSIIANNDFADVGGKFVSNGSNLIGNLIYSIGFLESEQLNVPITEVIDTKLQDNGGPVKTYALVIGSPAINAGLNADIPDDITDFDGDGNTTEPIPYDGRGRGFARISGGQVDIGAYETVIENF
jgi:hypothetical protein